MKYLLISVLTLSLMLGAYGYFFIWNKAHPDFEKLEADYRLPAEDLYKAFVKNAQLASKKFNGKMIELSGQVHAIEQVDTLTIAVFIFNEGMFGNEGIRCTFLSSEVLIEDPSDISGHVIKGFCSGFNDVDVILEKCSILK